MNWAELFFWISGFLIFYTYLGYPALLRGISIFVSKRRQIDGKHLPSVSMLIAAYNEETIIEEKLKNCLAIDYPQDKLEIIIGSDGSKDRTNEIVEKFARQKIRLVVSRERRGKAAVLNNLAQLAQGEIFVFSDANSMYRRDAITRLVPHFADEKVGGVCGRLVLLDQNGQIETGGERFYWDYENYLKYLEGKIKTVFGANGAIYAIRRGLYKTLPRDKVVTDDLLIPLSIAERGYDVVYEKEAQAYEFAAPDLKSEFKRKVRIGAGNFHGILEILPLLNPSKGFISFGLWSHKIIRWMVPFFLIVIFATNLMLLGMPFYDMLFSLQALFYILALVAWILGWFGIHIPLLIYPYYFVAVNLALLVGFFKFLTNAQKPAWARVER